MFKLNKLILISTYFYSILFAYCVHAQVRGGSVVTDTDALKDAVSQWGTTASGIAIIISASLAVTSLILPWKFFKETLGRASWVGLISAVMLFIVMSFFGNSIRAYISSMFQCALSIIGAPCS